MTRDVHDPGRRSFLRKSAALGAGAVAAPAALLQTINNGAKADGDPIPVGQASPQTGFAAPDGIEFKRGLELACEEINAMGGILGRPLEPHVAHDSASTYAAASSDSSTLGRWGWRAMVSSSARGRSARSRRPSSSRKAAAVP